MSKYVISENLYNYPMCPTEQIEAKQKALTDLMVKISKTPVRAKSWDKIEIDGKKTKEEFLACLSEDGYFEDLQEVVKDWEMAIRRVALVIMEDYHYTKGEDLASKIPTKVLKALVNYGTCEVIRGHRGPKRFHTSVFALPTCAFNMFLAMLPVMMKVEDDTCTCELWQKVYTVLNDLMLQAWTLPLRGDETDDSPVSIPRFQNHVWWVGGNGISFRPVFYTAICFRDIRMLDVLFEVTQKAGASKASQKEPAFWNEGICADGFGWGHGAQAYNNGYPTSSVESILIILEYALNTPWDYVLKEMNWDNIIHYIRGISWSVYESYIPPMMGRHSYGLEARHNGERSSGVKALNFARKLTNIFGEYLSESQKAELNAILSEGFLNVKDTENRYNGTRYFFNNDALISKNADRYFYFNMASKRCKGAECAWDTADRRNFYTCDGSYVVLADENAYEKTIGTWNVCHFPGVTERDLAKEEIMPEINWSGYNSIFDVAAGIGYDKCGVAGFIYQKSDYREPDGAGVVRDNYTKEMMGVRAYKSAFVYNDTFVLLGAGITDFKPEYGKNIVTTVNNTKLQDGVIIAENGEVLGDIKNEKDVQTDVYIKNDKLMYGIKALNNKIDVIAENRSTDWAFMSAMNEGAEDEVLPVLEVVINHGEKTVDNSYDYWISADMNKTPEEVNKMYTVLANNKNVQAVNFEDKLISAMFYEAAAFNIGAVEVSVSAPCALMLEKLEGESYKLTLADAKQDVDLKQITVSIGVTRFVAKERQIKMPTGNMIGKQVSVNI